jgi:hypothetical protein
MKAIHTTNRHGSASASDNDGNSVRISTAASNCYEGGHADACRALCKKMGWTGRIQGATKLTAGRTNGMVWVWVEPVDKTSFWIEP